MTNIQSGNICIHAGLEDSHVGLHGTVLKIRQDHPVISQYELLFDYRAIHQKAFCNIKGKDDFIVEEISLDYNNVLSCTHTRYKGDEKSEQQSQQWQMGYDENNAALVEMKNDQSGETSCSEIVLKTTNLVLNAFSRNCFSITKYDFKKLHAPYQASRMAYQIVPDEVNTFIRSLPHFQTLEQWADAAHDTMKLCKSNDSFCLKNRGATFPDGKSRKEAINWGCN